MYKKLTASTCRYLNSIHKLMYCCFFQKTKKPDFRCHLRGNCRINVTNRSHCPKCRLDACLSSGMKSDMVLTEQQRKSKYPCKKNNEKKADGEDMAPDTQEQNSEKLNVYPLVVHRDKEKEMSAGQEDICCITESYALQSVLENVCDANSSLTEKMMIQPDSETDKKPLIFILRNIIMENIQYFKTKAVKSLHDVMNFIDPTDWEDLVKQNVKLFVNFLLGQYLIAKNPFRKMLWLKGDGSNSSADLQTLAFPDKEIDWDSQVLFQSDMVMASAYVGFAEMLSSTTFQPQDKDIVAEIILFYPGSLVLKNYKHIWIHFQNLLQDHLGNNTPYQAKDVQDMLLTLQAMVELLEHSVLVKGGLLKCSNACDPNGSEPIMGYTFEESLWLGKLQGTILTKSDLIQYPTNLLNEIIDYSFHGRPLTPDFHKQTGRLFWENLWNLYSCYSEFQSLSTADQTILFLNSFKTVYTVVCIVLDGLPMEKVARVLFSKKKIEDNVFIQYMCKNPSQAENQIMPELKMPTIKDIYPTLPQSWIEKCKTVSTIFQEEDESLSIFLYLLVTAMFDGIPNQACKRAKWKGMASLRQYHLLNLARRFGREYECRINHVMCDLRVLSAAVDFI